MTDLVAGMKIGMLELLYEYPHSKRKQWMCFCECGRFSVRDYYRLRAGGVASCGCKRGSKCNGPRMKSVEPTRLAWMAMINRCKNKNADNYEYYGGRGIEVCEKWLEFEGFLEDMDEKPKGHSLDRKDNDLGYFKENCHWRNPVQQARNKRDNVVIEIDGKRGCISEWAEWTGQNQGLIGERLRSGWSPVDAVYGKKKSNKTPSSVIKRKNESAWL